MTMTTWRAGIAAAMLANTDAWSDSTVCTLDDAGLDTKFDDGYGGSQGKPFTLWTDNFVYFPAVYDGAEWVASVPRNPNGVATSHVGGE